MGCPPANDEYGRPGLGTSYGDREYMFHPWNRGPPWISSRDLRGDPVGAEPVLVIVDVRRHDQLVSAGAGHELLQPATDGLGRADERAGEDLVQQRALVGQELLVEPGLG